jgi:hypothetical protein
LIVFLFLAIAVALFAVQNAGPVTLRFGFWSVEQQSQELEALRASRPSTIPAPTASPKPQTRPPA